MNWTSTERPKPTTPHELLIVVRSMIENEENWCQGSYGDGNKHCLGGALSRGPGTQNLDLFSETMGIVRAEIPSDMTIAKFNDTHTHAEVIALVDRCIAKVTP